MRWERKAAIQRACSAMPFGWHVYRQIQKRFGALTDDPSSRIDHHLQMAQALAGVEFRFAGARCVEVGTGHVPVLPILFHLCGVAEVVTVDLNRRIDWRLTADAMRHLAARSDLPESYAGLVDESAFIERQRRLAGGASDPRAYLESVGIRYLAPQDASDLSVADAAFDLHFSNMVFEHVEPAALGAILAEARRVLRPTGYACHVIDPEDHYAKSDPSISPINFLRFSETEWSRIAGNEYGYCNRLRAPQYLEMFAAAGLDVIASAVTVDDRALDALEGGLRVDRAFQHFSSAELSTTLLEVVAAPFALRESEMDQSVVGRREGCLS